ncbi:MAG: hypothetical protein ACHQC9_00475 [Alphaproteobacteria bacterium]
MATDTGDCAAVIGDAGFIVPPRDPQALADAWQRMITLGQDGRRPLGLRARADRRELQSRADRTAVRGALSRNHGGGIRRAEPIG